MAINLEIEKNSNESNASMLRRFTKKVQGSGVLPRIRSIRYSKRKLSPYKVKVQRLNSISRKTEIEEGRFETTTKKSLLELKSVVDQFNFIYRIVTDISKTIRTDM